MAPERTGFVPTPGKDYFSQDIPIELMRDIAGYLELADRLKLRLILPKACEKIVESLLENAITQIPFFQDNVTELIFVGMAAVEGADFVRESIDDITSYKRACGFDWNAQGMDKAILSDASLMEKSYRLYSELSRDLEVQVELDHLYNKVEIDGIAILAEGMSCLSEIQSIKLRDNIDQPGLNGTSFWYSSRFAEGRIGNRPHRESLDPAGALAAQMVNDRHVGEDAFLEIVSGKFADTSESLALQLGDGLEQLNFALAHYYNEIVPAMKNLSPRLRKLIVNCEDDEHGTEGAMWLAVAQNATNLEELGLHLGGSYSPDLWHTKNHIGVTDIFLESGMLPKISKLTITGQRDRPGVMAKHAGTLKSVSLNGVLPVTQPGGRSITDTINQVIRAVQGHQLEFELQIFRRDHAGSCYPRDKPDTCDLECVHYRVQKKWIHRSVFEDLASELGVELIDGCWDFASTKLLLS